MKLQGWETVGSADEYREMIKAEYYRLKSERSNEHQSVAMEEVKLRLFLSLLDKPGSLATERGDRVQDAAAGLTATN